MSGRVKLSESCYLDREREVLIRDGRQIEISDRDLRVLEALVRENGQPVLYDVLEERIWTGAGEGFDVLDRRKAVRNSLSRLRKAIGEDCFRVKRGESVALKTALQEEGATDPIPVGTPLPYLLTGTALPYTDGSGVLHREREVKRLERLLNQGKQALLLCGAGGVGKTALARYLFFRKEGEYDSVGWVEYRGDLKSSLLSDLDLEEQVEDPQMRWSILWRRLKRDQSKKLIVINNVDRDTSRGQDPDGDPLLRSISGWPNTTVVLTSRLRELPGYRSHAVERLSREECEDLFYYYYSPAEHQKPPALRTCREAVQGLVEWADCHTYAVELLAKSAKYERDLKDYLDNIDTLGFRIPKLNIRTDHSSGCADAAQQLGGLFDLETRDGKEQQILWDFYALPHMELSFYEIRDLLGYEANDLDPLISEGWLTFQEGVSMHPLVREAISLKSLLAPHQTAHIILERMEKGTLISRWTSAAETDRLLSIMWHVLQRVEFPEHNRRIAIYRGAGAQCRREGLAKEAELYLRMAMHWQKKEVQRKGAKGESPDLWKAQLLLAECCADLGALLLAQGRATAEAEALCREALEIDRRLENMRPN